MKKLLVIILILFAVVAFTCIFYTILAGNSFEGFQEDDGGGGDDKLFYLPGCVFLSTITLVKDISDSLCRNRIQSNHGDSVSGVFLQRKIKKFCFLSQLLRFIPFLPS